MENLDANVVIQVFSERLNAMTTEMVVKDATIRQLTAQIESLTAANATKTATTSSKKNNDEEFK